MKKNTLIDRFEALKRFRSIPEDAHKWAQGHALIVGGSYGKMGSVCLSSKACLRSGAGLVTAYIPKCGYEIVQSVIPEAMVLTDDYTDHITGITHKLKVDAVGVGMGMGHHPDVQHALYHFLKMSTVPMVIDADALNIISDNMEWLEIVPPKTILTPHGKELERLLGPWESYDEMMEKTIAFSEKYNVVIINKGAPTYIVYMNSVFENTSGNQALATAGSGDVLTGILTALLAQGYASVDAAILGVYLHGLTANIAVPEIGYHSFIASDCIANLGKAFKSLY